MWSFNEEKINEEKKNKETQTQSEYWEIHGPTSHSNPLLDIVSSSGCSHPIESLNESHNYNWESENEI